MEMLKSGSKRVLLNYAPHQKSIEHAIQLIKNGKEQEALQTLQYIATTDGNTPNEEAIFVAGFVYEVLGLYPEAMGNFKRIIQNYSKGKLYRKAILRLAFINLGQGIRNGSNPLIKDASEGFYKVYEESDEPLEWKDAMAGYALTLCELNINQYAEEVFQKIDKHISLNPLYQFYRAENYLKIGELQKAKVIFQKLPELYSEAVFLSYALLKIGDITVLEGKEKEGELFYKTIIQDNNRTMEQNNSEFISSDAAVMGKLALSELYMNQKRSLEAMNLLKGLADGPASAQVKHISMLYFISISEAEGRYKDVLSTSKQVLSSSDSNTWKMDTKAVLDKTVSMLITDAYNKKDYKKVIRLYYDNRAFIKDKAILMMAGEGLLNMGMPTDAEAVYQALRDGNDTRVSLGLCKSLIMNGDVKMAAAILKKIKPNGEKERMDRAGAFWSLGDLYFRNGEFNKALEAYSEAKSGLDKPELHYKLAQTYALLGEGGRASTIYSHIINNPSDQDIKAMAILGLGDVWYLMKRWEQALSAYTKGMEMITAQSASGIVGEQHNLMIIYRIGELHLMFGNNKQAVEAWDKVAKEDKGYLGKLAEERLKEVNLWNQARM